jgi:hypothetical protein
MGVRTPQQVVCHLALQIICGRHLDERMGPPAAGVEEFVLSAL